MRNRKNYKKQFILGGKALWMAFINLPNFIGNGIGTPKNKLEIAVVAQRRSGHHAIVNWMRYNMDVPSLFINNCYSTANPLLFNSDINLVSPPSKEEIAIRPTELSVSNSKKRTCLIYNYEDQRLSYIKYYQTKINRVAWLGKSEKYFKVMVIRDPFNLLASKLKWVRGKEKTPSIDNLFFVKNQWKRYANYYIEHAQKDGEIICIDYNSWFAKEEKRKEYALRLGLISHHEGVKKIAQYGPTKWGDSFDGLEYENKAQEMKVLERWKNYKEDMVYLELIKDKELIRLSQLLYADFPAIKDAIEFANSLYK